MSATDTYTREESEALEVSRSAFDTWRAVSGYALNIFDAGVSALRDCADWCAEQAQTGGIATHARRRKRATRGATKRAVMSKRKTIAPDAPLSDREIEQAIAVLRGEPYVDDLETMGKDGVITVEHDPTGYDVSRCACGCGEVTASLMFITRRRADVARDDDDA